MTIMKEKIYKFVPVTTLVASIIIAVVLDSFVPIIPLLLPLPYNFIGLFVVGFGMYIVFQSVRLLILHNTTLEPNGSPSSLVTQCPYTFSRNPIYLGLLLITMGTAFTLSSFSSFIAPLIFFLVVNTIVIPFEENKLQRNFGLDYDRYRTSVRRWL
jgi:protein-S-isoprenylcysteine O-methyltransferase Ste14